MLCRLKIAIRGFSSVKKTENLGTAFGRKAFMDVTINGSRPKRICFRIYEHVAPMASTNFIYLCRGGYPGLHYKGCMFTYIVPGFVIQGGDVEYNDGTGGLSLYGDHFPRDQQDLDFDRPYLLAMASKGPDKHASQFFITLAPTPWLNTKHTIFGEVVEGKDVVDEIQKYGSETGRPKAKIEIEHCGELHVTNEDLVRWMK